MGTVARSQPGTLPVGPLADDGQDKREIEALARAMIADLVTCADDQKRRDKVHSLIVRMRGANRAAPEIVLERLANLALEHLRTKHAFKDGG